MAGDGRAWWVGDVAVHDYESLNLGHREGNRDRDLDEFRAFGRAALGLAP